MGSSWATDMITSKPAQQHTSLEDLDHIPDGIRVSKSVYTPGREDVTLDADAFIEVLWMRSALLSDFHHLFFKIRQL